MATLQIRKKSAKVWAHVISDGDTFILSKMYCKTDGDTFRIVEDGGSSRKEYDYSNITVYDDTDASTPETFLNSQALMLRLSALGYVGFSQDGEVVIADLISTDPSNAIELGTDGKLFSRGGVGTLQEVTDLGNSTTNAINVGVTTVKGTGTTSSTKALIIRDSAGTEKASINDAGDITANRNILGLEAYLNRFSVPVNSDGFTSGALANYIKPLSGSWEVKTQMKYLADYSSSFTDRSLVDKAYVDSVVVSGSGDMTKAVYDTDDDGIVDSAKKEMVAFINKSGSTITKGTIVYLKSSSSSASYPEVLKANATTEATSSKTIGAVYEDVANDATGYVVTSGEVNNLDTSTYAIGDKLWLSTTDGLVTTTAPTQPNHAVFIGTVTRSQSTNGRILYAIQNGYELNELHNVLITSVADKQLLSYDNATSLWKNKSVTTNDISEGSNLYFTNARAIASTLTSFVAGTGAISSSDTILTAIQKLAGNAGLKKVINDTTASANQTLTTEVVMKTYEITGGTFVSGSKPNITIGSTKTSGSNAVYTMRLYAGSTNVFASATLIGTYATTSAFIRGFNFERRSFYFDGTTLNGFIPSSAVITDIGQLSTTAWGGMTLNPANSIFIFITLQNGSGLDTTKITFVNITE